MRAATAASSAPSWVRTDERPLTTHCGRICIGWRKINLSKVVAGRSVGVREVADQVWLVSFMDYDLGFFDKEEGCVEPAINSFGPESVLTMSPE